MVSDGWAVSIFALGFVRCVQCLPVFCEGYTVYGFPCFSALVVNVLLHFERIRTG